MTPECRVILLDVLESHQEKIIRNSADWALTRCVDFQGKKNLRDVIDHCTDLFVAVKETFRSGNYSVLNDFIQKTVRNHVANGFRIGTTLMSFLCFKRGLEPVLRKRCADPAVLLEAFTRLDSIYEYCVSRASTLYGESVFRTARTASNGGGLPPDEALRRAETLWAVQREIEDRKLAETQLLESRGRLELALRGADIGMWDSNIQTGEVFFDDRWAEMLGYGPNELGPRPGLWEDLVHPEDKARAQKAMQSHIEGLTPLYEDEHRLKTQSGEWKWVLDRGKVVEWDLDGKPLRASGTQQDVHDRKSTEEALRESENRLQAFLDNSTAVIYMKDAQGRYLLVNHQWERIFGHAQEEVRGKTSHDIFTPEDAEISWDYDRTVLASGAAIEIEEIAPHEDGPHVYLSTKFPLCDEDGKPYAVCGMATDITERKRTELEIRKLSLAVEQSPSLVVITDPEGRIEYVNPRFTQVTGFDSGEVEGTDVLELGEQAPEEKEEMRGIISSGGEWHGEFLNRTKSSGVYWEEATVTPLKDDEGRITHLLKVAEDVTERKRSEERLKKTLADLERSNKELEQFAYVASHDLQEPLRVVTSYMNLLERRYQEQLDADARKFIAYAVDASRRMKNLIEDLLAYSRVETRAGAFEPTDFDSVLDEALANLEAAINESGAVIRREPLPTLLADGSQLAQLFQNLVGNAVKFRGEEAPEIRISAALEDDGWHFSVSDNGIGIEPRHTGRIFEIFKRLHTREEYPGTGIGLAICKKIVERHGGRIWVESSAGEGATFNFSIPIVGGPNP